MQCSISEVLPNAVRTLHLTWDCKVWYDEVVIYGSCNKAVSGDEAQCCRKSTAVVRGPPVASPIQISNCTPCIWNSLQACSSIASHLRQVDLLSRRSRVILDSGSAAAQAAAYLQHMSCLM